MVSMPKTETRNAYKSADNTDWYGYNATSGGKVKIVFDTGSGSSDWQNTYFSITELTIN